MLQLLLALILKCQKAGGGQSKVADLHLAPRIKENINRLQITMNHALLMDMRQALSYLTEQLP